MILQKNNLFVKNYKIINILFAGIFGIIFLYSGIFSAQKNNHPIPSACIVKPCSSTGLSRGFSEIIRFNFESAKKYNKNAIPIFTFFLVQLILRLFLVKILTNTNARALLFIDVFISVSFYIYSFSGIIFAN